MIQLKQGFKGQRLIAISSEILLNNELNPLTSSLYITKIGFFPAVKYHYNKKENGVDYYIIIYCTSGEVHPEILTSDKYHMTVYIHF